MKRVTKLILLNSLIAVGSVICYSPGLLALRPGDASVLRAGSSLFVGFLALTGLGYGNYKILNDTPKKELFAGDDINDLSQVYGILEQYSKGKFFGPVARTVTDQIKRFQKSAERARWEVDRKFNKGSMTWERYSAVLDAAEAAVLHDVAATVSRMQLFDEKEYERLQHYKDDNIPDDIQEKQIEIYKQNISLINDAIAKNETMILRLDTLSVKLSETDMQENSEVILDEISTLTQELKYYT